MLSENLIQKPVFRLLKEGLWVTIGQITAAVATIAGIRFITELAEPSLYGKFVLINGIIALLQGILFHPMAQAAFRYYPEFEKNKAIPALRRYLSNVFLKRWLYCSAILLVCALIDALTFRYISISIWILVSFNLVLESWKVVEIVMRNASRRQSAYATLLAADSIARPLGAILLAWMFGGSTATLLAGQTMGILLVLTGFTVFAVVSKNSDSIVPISKNVDTEHLKQNMTLFAKPLLLMPIVGWISGLADRYIVGGVLGLAQAGIYAAAYGIASRPFLLLSGITEATLRQPLYAAFSNLDPRGTRRLITTWVAFNILIGVIGVFLIYWLQKPITSLLLAENYYDAADLLTWIATGYVFLIIAQAVERLIYAAKNTLLVIHIQFISSGVGLLLAYIASKTIGLKGVALAVPIYFGLQLLITLFYARRILIQQNIMKLR